MVGLNPINIYPKHLPLYLSYGEYDIAMTGLAVGFLPFDNYLTEGYLSFPSIKQVIETTQKTTQISDTADNYWFSNDLINIISERLFEIPAIECIFLSMEEDTIQIMTVIDKYDKDVTESIYNAEYDLIEVFKDIFFDFYIIYKEDREIEDIWPQGSVVIFRR